MKVLQFPIKWGKNQHRNKFSYFITIKDNNGMLNIIAVKCPQFIPKYVPIIITMSVAVPNKFPTLFN